MASDNEVRIPLPDVSTPMSAGDLERVDAVNVFITRARIARPSFELNDENGEAVARICVRLDGLPLAIELAAARIKLLTPGALLARLDQRLPLLTQGSVGLPDRQRTLRDTIAWSYDRLINLEQQAFQRLSVFAGCWNIEAASEVAGIDDEAKTMECDLPSALGVATSLCRFWHLRGHVDEGRSWFGSARYPRTTSETNDNLGRTKKWRGVLAGGQYRRNWASGAELTAFSAAELALGVLRSRTFSTASTD